MIRCQIGQAGAVKQGTTVKLRASDEYFFLIYCCNFILPSNRINLKYKVLIIFISISIFLFMKTASNNKINKNENSADWVCCNCNNLNYSFRKVCNRCKSMTKEENHQNLLQLQYYQMYYQQAFSPQEDKFSPQMQ